jgi:aryl-alcohol dehydrogenase-like predicted oxidoreductase
MNQTCQKHSYQMNRESVEIPRYLAAVEQLARLARDRYSTRVVHLAVRWMLDQGISVALWGARRPDQLHAAVGVAGWSIDRATRAAIDRILSATIPDPIGPEFMAPPQRS